MSEHQEITAEQINMKIGDFKANIHQYHAALNDEGVWLFLSTLGCWGVSDSRFKFAALLITLVLFVWRMNERRMEKRSFQKVIKALEVEVKERLERDEVIRDATLYKLVRIKEDQLSYRYAVRKGWPFIITWTFFGFTFLHFAR